MVSPYLLRPRRSLEEALTDRLRQGRPVPAGLHVLMEAGEERRRDEGSAAEPQPCFASAGSADLSEDEVAASAAVEA